MLKVFRRAVAALFLATILLVNAVSHAEIYIGEGSYCMSEGENLGVAKERAKADTMRLQKINHEKFYISYRKSSVRDFFYVRTGIFSRNNFR